MQLSGLMKAFGQEVFPAYLEAILPALSPVPELTGGWADTLIDTTAYCCAVISMNDTSILHPQVVSPRLLLAVAMFSRWLTSYVDLLSLDGRMRAMRSVGSIMYSSCVDGPCTRPASDNSVIDDIFLMACAVSGAVLKELSAVSQATLSMIVQVTMHGLVFHARDLDMDLAHIPSRTVSVLQDLVPFLLVLVASARGELSGCNIRMIYQLLDLFCDMNQVASQVPPQAFTVVTLTRFVRSIHTCSQAYSDLSPVLVRLLIKTHHYSLVAPTPDALVACRVTLDLCMSRARSWMQHSVVRGSTHMQQYRMCRSDLATVAGIIIETKILNGSYWVRGVEGRDQLTEDFTTTAFINGLEAMLRSVDLQQGVGGCIHATCWVISAVLAKAVITAHQYRAIFSLFTTMRKVFASAAASGAKSTVLGLILVYDTLQATSAAVSAHEKFRFQVITKLCLQPLFVALEGDADPMWSAIARECANSLPRVPDCVVQPRDWSEPAHAYMLRFPGRGRLLSGCGSPWCSNLCGLLDHLLPRKLCAGCRRVRYCSVDCQRRDWVTGGHSGVCASKT